MIIQKIQEVIINFMTNLTSFSAHDVTVELRAQGETVFHNQQTKALIHSEIAIVLDKYNYEKVYAKAEDDSIYQLYQPASSQVSTNLQTTNTASINDFTGRDLNFEFSSSWINGACWNSQTEQLFVETKFGKSYIYQDVDAKTVLEWEVSDSVGEYFNENIKSRFTFVKS